MSYCICRSKLKICEKNYPNCIQCEYFFFILDTFCFHINYALLTQLPCESTINSKVLPTFKHSVLLKGKYFDARIAESITYNEYLKIVVNYINLLNAVVFHNLSETAQPRQVAGSGLRSEVLLGNNN